MGVHSCKGHYLSVPESAYLYSDFSLKQTSRNSKLFLLLKITPSQSFSTAQCSRKALVDNLIHFRDSEGFLSVVRWHFKGSVSPESGMMRHFPPETFLNTPRFLCYYINLYSQPKKSLFSSFNSYTWVTLLYS